MNSFVNYKIGGKIYVLPAYGSRERALVDLAGEDECFREDIVSLQPEDARRLIDLGLNCENSRTRQGAEKLFQHFKEVYAGRREYSQIILDLEMSAELAKINYMQLASRRRRKKN